jgi:DNA helicase-2/ATP-dependent DNA helicase PcrA
MSFDYTLKSPERSAAPVIDYRAALNDEQYRAVTAEPGPLLVIAGAGSGKTRTLTYRVAWLIEHGVPPDRILLLTFTNKAAKEMLRRVGDLLPQDISRLWGGTFHHVCHRLLRRHAEEAGLEKNFTIMDREDSKAFMSACLADAGIDEKDKRFPKSEVLLDIFSFAAGTRKPISEILQARYPYFEELADDIARTGEVFARRKREANTVDYDDLLVLCHRMLQDHALLRERYQERFAHILVDEYQDTNKIQSDLVDLLGGRHHRVMVVGDDAQSIYSWRGAHFANIMNFPDRHPGASVIRIETNYRSIPEILQVANSSIAQNTKQFPKELRSIRESGTKPAIVALEDGRQQAMFVAQRILELHDEGTPLNEMAVLYRSHFHSMELQMELTRRNIPFHITSGLRFFEQAHVKDLSAFLKYALNGKDEVSFKRVALMLPGIGNRTAHKLWLESRGRPLGELKPPGKAAKAWSQWALVHGEVRGLIEGGKPGHLLQLFLEAVYEDHLKVSYPNYENRLEDLRQLIEFAEGFADSGEFLSQLSLMTNMDAEADPQLARGEEGEAVKLSSIHQAKGLEWNVVFAIMLCDGLFPSFRSLESMEGEEEERRLFYVAVTRAKDELYLTYPRIRDTGGYGDTWQTPSRFLSDFPRELCNTWNIKTESAPEWE